MYYLKKQICKSIFSSFHFDYQHETPIIPSHRQIRHELKHSYRDIYNQLFCDPQKSQIRSMRRKKCSNPWTIHTVSVPEHHQEWVKDEIVFMCLVRENHTGLIKQYFVSREYNLGSVTHHSNEDYIAGRFVFEFRSSDPLSLHALAEQPAYIMMEQNVELVYLRAKKDEKAGTPTECFNTISLLSIVYGRFVPKHCIR